MQDIRNHNRSTQNRSEIRKDVYTLPQNDNQWNNTSGFGRSKFKVSLLFA